MNSGIGGFAGIVSVVSCAEGCAAGEIGGILTEITTHPASRAAPWLLAPTGSLVGIISFGLVALNSVPTTAGNVVPGADVARLVNGQMACAGQPSC